MLNENLECMKVESSSSAYTVVRIMNYQSVVPSTGTQVIVNIPIFYVANAMTPSITFRLVQYNKKIMTVIRQNTLQLPTAK